MVDRIEGVRRNLGLGPWIFWGMSGGGWLAQIYARRYPEALVGIVIESACLCFRERLADPECLLSPFFPAWHNPLRAAGLFPEGSHLEASSGHDTDWVEVDGVGLVFRRHHGPALLVSPGPLEPEMKSVMPHLWCFDSRAWIRSVRVPALVLCGTADPVLPVRHARAVHEAIVGSVFAEIVGGGHVPVAQRRPEVTKAFQSFISGLGPEI
jgi:pimeloyl-ACP methyl ester carboxylesterase